MQPSLGEVTRRIREPPSSPARIYPALTSRAARVSAWLPAWPTRSGVRGSRASATPERGTKFIPTQGHLCSSPRVDESPRSSGVQAGRARVRQDSSGSASGWLGLWRGRTSAPGRGAAGRHSGSGRAWGTRGASRWRAGWDSEEGSGLTAHREALGPRGRTSWRGEGALSGGRAGAGGGGSGAAPSCLHPWHGAAAAAAAAAAGARRDPLGPSPAQSEQETRRGPASSGPGARRRESGRAAGGRQRRADSRARVLPAGALVGHASGARRRGPRGSPPPRAPRPALGRPGPPLSTPPARPDPSGRRADWPWRCGSPRGDGLMGAAGRRMRGAPARLLLPLLLPWLLLLTPETRGAPGCPVPIRSCKCSGERPKGLSGGAPNPARRRVVCGGGDLPEPPDPGLLPNSTVTLLLSNNKITGLRSGAFLGLSLLEKLDLRNNVISTVQPGAFLGLGELKRLDLSNNRIGCLTSGTFQGLPRLLRLNISGNIFSSLQPGVFDELPALKVVDFGTEFLTCDCRLRWLFPWARNRSLQLSERTLCAYPSALHAQALAGLQEAQLRCEGALELHTHHLIPSLRQVVFQGDRLPFQCSASYLGNDTRIRWYHNRAPVEGDEQAGVLLADSLVHDCTFITSELTLSHIGVWASGEWECSVSTVQGNASKKVEIVVLETSASYCPAERVANNRGDFRWPRTLAGITAYQSCLQYPFTSVPLSGGAPGTRASRRCDRAGRWEPGDYSHCLYTNDITRVLYTFVLMPINASNALTLAHQLRVYTAEAASFSDMMDVVYVAQMIQKFLGYVDQIKELVEVMVDMASNLMLVDEHLLWLAQREDKACSGIVGALERIGGAALSPHAQHISVVPWASWEAAPTREAQGGALEMTGVSPSPHHPRASPSVGQPCARFIKNPNMTRVPSRSCGIKFQLVRGSAEEREASDTTEVTQGFVRGTELKGCVVV